jgi:creatinine amidohydrolase
MRWHEHSTTALADALADVEVAVLPVGSTEQHGPALAVGMDHLAAEAVARTLDRPDAAVLPTLPVGVSEHHRQFHGTLYVADDTFEAFVRETLASAAEHGVRKAVVVNGHGGNTGALKRAAMGLRADREAFVAPYNWWQGLDGLADELFDEDGGHADALETSVLWHLDPDLVDPDALEDAEAGASESWGKVVEGADVGFDAADFTESGVAGRPTQADPEKGERAFERSAATLDALVDWLVERDPDDLWPRAHR